MKSSIWTVMKKELSRFFGDRRILFSSVLLPGLMIYVMYTFMGSAIGNMAGTGERALSITAMEIPPSMTAMLQERGLSYESFAHYDQDEADRRKEKITAKELDLLMVFPANFDGMVAEYDIGSGAAAPNVQLYYNSASGSSAQAYSQAVAMLDFYESSLANKFDVNNGQETFDLASEKDVSGQMFSSMMPLLLTIFLFSGCLAIAPESIAGEKERGTLSTLLVTPLRRSELALGKIFAITIVAVCSAVSSTLGTILSLPKLFGSSGEQLDVFYTTGDYLLLAVVILSTVLLFVSMISIFSALARSVKEAQTYVLPLMVVVMLVGISGMFGHASGGALLYLIPVYNSVQCMSGIFSFELSRVHVMIAVISNLVYCGILAFVLTRMFHSEKVMFAR